MHFWALYLAVKISGLTLIKSRLNYILVTVFYTIKKQKVIRQLFIQSLSIKTKKQKMKGAFLF